MDNPVRHETPLSRDVYSEMNLSESQDDAQKVIMVTGGDPQRDLHMTWRGRCPFVTIGAYGPLVGSLGLIVFTLALVWSNGKRGSAQRIETRVGGSTRLATECNKARQVIAPTAPRRLGLGSGATITPPSASDYHRPLGRSWF